MVLHDAFIQNLERLVQASPSGAASDTRITSTDVLFWAVRQYLTLHPSERHSALAENLFSDLHSENLVSFSALNAIEDALGFDSLKLTEEDWGGVLQSAFGSALKDRARSGQVYSSSEINNYLINGIDVRDGFVFFDPACGIGQTFVHLHEKYPNLNLKFIGQEINPEIYLLCEINLLFHGISDAEVYLGDSTRQLPPITARVDVGICDPPFDTQRMWLDHGLAAKLIQAMLDVTGSYGVVSCIVPLNVLFGERTRIFREQLLRNDWVETVTSLHNYWSYIAHIVLNKAKSQKGLVVFDGTEPTERSSGTGIQVHFAYEKFERTNVPIDDIVDADLRPRLYALTAYKKLRDSLYASGYPVRRMHDLVVKAQVGRMPRRDEASRDVSQLPSVRVGDLAKRGDDVVLDISKVVRTAPVTRESEVISTQVVLCSLLGAKPNPTLFDARTQPILIGSDVIAVELNEDVNPEYVVSQLLSPLVQAQVDARSTGVTHNRIKKSDFLNLELIVPPLAEQTRQALEFFKTQQRKLQQDIVEEKREVKLAEYDVIRVIVHDLNHKLAAIQADLTGLKGYIEKEFPDHLSRPIKPVFDGDSEAEIDSFRLGTVLERLIKTRNEASSQLAATREVLQNNTVRPSRRNFKKWLEKEIVPLHRNELSLLVEGEDFRFDFDAERFAEVIRNLVINARQHGAKKAVFELSRVKESVRILFKNDGAPFPKDFDFNSHFKGLYHKSAQSKGSGIGGYYINKIIELHNGEMRDVSPRGEELDLFPVQIEFTLPIEYQENPIYGRSNPYSTN